MRGFIIRGGLGLQATPGGTTTGPAAGVGSMSWVPPSLNTDNSAITPGEIVGYQVGVRPDNGVPGIYTIFLAVNGPYTSAQLISMINPPLTSGNYYAAVRTSGTVNSAWSNESFFTV